MMEEILQTDFTNPCWPFHMHPMQMVSG